MTKEQLEKLAEEGKLNTGLDVDKLVEKPEDWIAGGKVNLAGILSGIKYRVILKDGDWRRYMPKGETQKYNTFDDYACTHHTACDGFETAIKQMIIDGWQDPDTGEWFEIDTTKIKDWIDKNGDVNFSDRFNAYTGGNIPGKGNSLTAGPEAFKDYGCCPESYWPALMNYSEKEFYSKPDKRAYDKAKEILNYFSFNYESLERVNSPLGKKLGYALVDIEDVIYHQKQCPISIATAICPGWFSDDVVKSCSLAPSHATLNAFANATGSLKTSTKTILDHYPDYIRKLDWIYPIFYAVKLVVTPKPIILKKKVMTTSRIIKDKDGNGLSLVKTLTSESACYSDLRAHGIPFLPKKDENGQDIPNTVEWSSITVSGLVEWFK
jgi:hypothetical protein